MSTMTLQAFREWVTRINGLVAVALDCESMLAEANARLELAKRGEDKRGIERAKMDVVHQRKQFDLGVALLLDATASESLDQVQQILTDVRMAILNATELYESWRKVELLLVMLDATAGFSKESGEGKLTREDGHAKADRLNQEYQTALVIIAKLIPTPVAG